MAAFDGGLNERHAQRLLGEFRNWYNQDRVHLAYGVLKVLLWAVPCPPDSDP
jgi:hypothetical protein